MKLPPLPPLERFAPTQQLETREIAGGSAIGGFDRVINQLLGTASTSEAAANEAVQGLADGTVDDIHTVALAVTQADLSFRLILEMRNRLQEAYQEITRLQI